MRIHKTLVAAVTLLLTSVPANAAQIIGSVSLTGAVKPVGSNEMASATGLDFFNIFTPGATGLGVAGPVTTALGTGTFASILCVGGCGSIKDLPNFMPGPIANFITFGVGGAFDLTSITSIDQTANASGGSLTIFALGTFHYTGFADTAAMLTLTTQGNGPTTFSSIALTAVPEPASWALMIAGFGFMGGALRASRRSLRVRVAAR